MNRQRLYFVCLALLIAVFALIGSRVQYQPDLVQTMAVLGSLCGSIAGMVAR